MPNSNDKIDLDGVLKEIGQFGRFQIKQYGLMVFPIIFHAFALSFVFTAGNLNYRCLVPECEATLNTTYRPEWLNYTIPFRGSIPSKCERFLPKVGEHTEKCDKAVGFDSRNVIKCNNFVFQDDEVTIVKDFDVTCPHNDWKLTLVGTVNNIGQFVALPISGYLSDRFGRRLVLLLSVAGSTLFGVLRAYSTSYEIFLVFEFLDPAIGSSVYATAFMLALELVAPGMRVTGNTILSCTYAFGVVLLGLLAMYFRNWRTLLKVLYIPGIFALPFLWITSESVRWYLSKGYRRQAFAVLQKAAQMNGRNLPSTAIEKYCIKNDFELDTQEEASFFNSLKNAFQKPGLMLRVVNCSFCWITNVLVYYGLSLNSVMLAGDKYVNFILVSLAELPAYVLLQLILDRIGRRPTLCSSMLLCGLFCFLSEFIPTDSYWPNLAMFLVSKMTITISFTTLYIYTAEIFPTNLRQILFSICSMFGRIGSMIAPQTPLLAKVWTPLPMVVFGSIGIISGLTVIQFPETLNTNLPSTVEEAMSMDKIGGDRETGQKVETTARNRFTNIDSS